MVVPGIGDLGDLKIKLVFVIDNGYASRTPSLITVLHAALLSKPVPLSVTTVSPTVGPRGGSTLLITGST